MNKEGLEYHGRREELPVTTPLEEQVAADTAPLRLTYRPYEKQGVQPQPEVAKNKLPETGDFAAGREGLRSLHRYYNDSNR